MVHVFENGADVRLITIVLLVFFLRIVKYLKKSYILKVADHLEQCCVFSDFEHGSSSSRLTSSLVTVVFMGILISLRLLKLWYFIYGNSGLLSGCIFFALSSRYLRRVLDGKFLEENPINTGVP